MGEAVKIAKVRKAPKNTHLLVQVKRGERTVRSGASRSGRVRWGPTVGIEIPYPVLGVDTRETLFQADRRGARRFLRTACHRGRRVDRRPEGGRRLPGESGSGAVVP